MITKRIATLLLLSCTLYTVSDLASASSNNLRKTPSQKTTPTNTQPSVSTKPALAPAKASFSNGVLTVGGVTYKFVYVAPGTFTMGATSEQTIQDSDEIPVHKVKLTNGYYIGQTEVTQALWKAIMGSTPSHFIGDNLPVECISWNDCQDFIGRLNDLTGKRFRLPTEAEWEFAIRGGCKSRGMQYSGAQSLDNCAWYDGNSGSKTHPVATKQANELGIYDMSGNVWEWCQDWEGSYNSNAVTNPTGPNSGSKRVVRGGSWYSFPRDCRVANRNFIAPDYQQADVGLRLVL